MSDLIEEINKNDQFKTEVESGFKTVNLDSIGKVPDTLPSYQVKAWEKHYMIIYDETDIKKLIEMSQTHFDKYISLLHNSQKPVKSFTGNFDALFFIS